MNPILFGLSLVVGISNAFAQTDALPKCELAENAELAANLAHAQADGSVVFQNPSCAVQGKPVAIVVAYSGCL